MRTLLLVATLLLFLISKDKNNFSTTMNSPQINLPSPSFKGNVSVEEALLKRRSIRNYTDQPLTLEQVSQLLWAAYGVTKKIGNVLLKTAPSAGATYPLEIYVMVGNVVGLEPGIYKYNPENHTIKLHLSGDLRQQVTKACLSQTMISRAPISIIYAAVYERTTVRYGQRGRERYVPMDVGHSAQNVYLQATAMGLGTCAVGAFDDAELAAVVKLPDKEEPIYLMPVGYPK